MAALPLFACVKAAERAEDMSAGGTDGCRYFFGKE